MLHITLMTNTLVNTFRAIPEMPTYLANGDVQNIIPYIDAAPTPNHLLGKVYGLKSGQVLVAFEGTEFNEGGEDMSEFSHRFIAYLRSAPDTSLQDMSMALINGIPTGSNLRWRLMCLLPELYTANLLRVFRETDSQMIDYFGIEVELKEKGDA